MDFEQTKEEFINTWGVIGQQWGINKAMSQIHALLLIANEPLTMEQIMISLHASRGNVSMNLRSLMEWGLIEKVVVPGNRKEHYRAEKNVMEMAKRIAAERRKREIEPTIRLLKKAATFKAANDEEKAFVDVTQQLASLTESLDTFLRVFDNISEENLSMMLSFVEPKP